jgi:GWxTD domain-containing protein
MRWRPVTSFLTLFILLSVSARLLAIDALVSHSVFYLPDNAQPGKLSPSVEVYWQINPHSVHYTTTPEKTIIARIKTDITFSNETGTIKEDQFILKTVPRANINELMMHSIIDLRRYPLMAGEFKMKLVLTDLADSLHPFTFTDNITIQPVLAGKAFYSDPQLLDTILESPAQTIYKKNGHQQVPECTNFLDESKTILHYYAELYQGDKISKLEYPLIQKVSISKKENEQAIGRLIRRDTVSPGELMTVSGDFSITTLPSGNYYLNITLENNARLIVATQSLFFQRLNTHPASEDTSHAGKQPVNDTGIENIKVLNLGKTFLARYTTPEISKILKMMLPISDPLATQTIHGFLKKPDDLYMRYFIYNYFVAINSKNPSVPWKEYADKVKECNKLFNDRGKQGYETERGFIYLRYGPPTETVTVENETGALPYEIWQYNVLTQTNHKDIANAVFLFYKPNQELGDYQLLHCTVEGEAQNTAWRSYLYTGGMSNNSRADQYMGNR